MNKCEFKDIKEALRFQFKEDLETFKSLYDPLNCFFVDVEKIEKALKYTFEFLLENLENSNDLKDYLILDNNEKINKKGLIIGYSIKPYVLCDNMLNGGCKISKFCYASKNELAFKRDKKGFKRYYSLEKTLKNYIFYHYILLINDKFYNYGFLRESLEDQRETLKKFKILRFNIKSDFEDQTHLNFCNDLFKILKSDFDFIKAYSYTKTKGLNFEALDSDFLVNKSVIIENENDLNKINPNHSQFITVTKKELEEKILEKMHLEKCKNQTQNLKCFECFQCMENKAKYNNLH